VRSESGWAVPDEAVRAYLDDPFVREVMREAGWSERVPRARIDGAGAV